MVRSILAQAEGQRPVEYMSFGSGGMFQDLVILTKALAQKPDLNITVHMLDPKFTPYVEGRDLLANGRAIDENVTLDISSIKDLFRTKARENGVDESVADDQLDKQLQATCEHIELPFKQLLSFLKKTFPKASFSLEAHATAKNYLNYREKCNLAYPDIIAAADIQDEMSRIGGSMPDFDYICGKTLLQNKKAYTVLLGKNKNQGTLMNLSLDGGQGKQKTPISIDGKQVDVYTKEEVI